MQYASQTLTNVTASQLPTPVVFQNDANGNLTNDGLRSFTYDDENQLTDVTIVGQSKSDFLYDGFGRRRITRDYSWNGNWNLTNEVHYVYDGNVVIQERDANNNVLVTYDRGLDLSGSLQGAGGIGGLLARTDIKGTVFYHSDAMGNVTMLVDRYQTLEARYLYDPFGNIVGKWGPYVDVNRYRFSSKEFHPLSGLYYFGFRFYDPNLQRFLNHDLLGELGGINLYRAVANSPVNRIDPLGLAWWQFWNWSIFNWNAPSLPQSTVDQINSSGSGIWIDPNLSDQNSFDQTFVGSFSLNNLANGNLGEYGESVGETLGVKGPIYLFGRKVCPKAANVALKGVSVAGTTLTVGATAYDLGNGLINNSFNQVWNSSAGPAGPGETYVGGGLIVSDPGQLFQ